MRTRFVLTTIGLALALGIIAGVAEGRLLTRALIIGFGSAIWAASYVIERLTGRDMWHMTAPYPYPRMREHGQAASSRPIAVRELVENMPETHDDGSKLPLAA